MSEQFIHDSAGVRRLTLVVLALAVAYQALLCLLHTHVIGVPRALVGAGEGLILLATLPLLLPRLVPGVIAFAAIAGAVLCLLTLVSGNLDVKAFRDLIIPFVFFWAGRNVGDRELAERGLLIIVALVLVFGFFELFALDLFTRVFDIYSYYISIGNLEPVTEYTRDSRLQLNGIRPEDIGRTLLPGLLDNHRVSSLFLEPISLGNFATVLAAWALSQDNPGSGRALVFLGAAWLMVVMADSRFALVTIVLLVFTRLLLRAWALWLPVILPLLVLTLLVMLGRYAEVPYSDSYLGRLIVSGHSLVQFDVPTLLGYDRHASYPDEGFAYTISSFGLPLAVALWLSLWLLPMADEPGRRFRCFVAIYITLILCVSGTSLFALKSAGVLWFLLGCTMRDPAPLPATMGRRGADGSRSPAPATGREAGA